jgi:hypothetical protein
MQFTVYMLILSIFTNEKSTIKTMDKMRFFILLILSLFIFTTTAQNSSDRIPGELLIMLKKGANPDIDPSLKTSIEALGMSIDKKVTRSFNIWLIRFDEQSQIADKVLQRIKNHPMVEIAQFNHLVHERETLPDDPNFNQQWAFKNTGQAGGTPGADIKATEAWDISTSGVTALGDTIVVAVVDGGIDLNHFDINLFKNRNEIPSNNIDDDNNGYIDDYNGWNAYNNSGNLVPHDHGTHVAGIIGAKTNNGLGVAGVSYNAKILPVAGSGSSDVLVAAAYDYVYTMRKQYNESMGQAGAFIVASNSSFGVNQGDPVNYPLWGAMYDSMGLVGIANVAATANAGWDVDIESDIPTAMTNESLITVTNTTNLDVRNSQAAWGLNSIDLGAPGTNIFSTRQNNLYGSKTGTSMATPMVSGSVALMYAVTDSTRMQEYKMFPTLAVSRFKRYLIATVDTISSLATTTVSGGRLNLLNAISMAANPPMLSSLPVAINISLKPDTIATTSIQISSSSTEPNPYFISIPPDTTWLSVDTNDGIFIPAHSETLNITFNTSGMAEGTYYAALSVNDYFLNQMVIPIILKVDFESSRSEVTNNPSVSLSPNPFEESIKISINLQSTSEVDARVISLQGKTIAAMHYNSMPAGVSTFTWNGRSANNQIVSPGVYLFIVTDKYGSVTKKCIKK